MRILTIGSLAMLFTIGAVLVATPAALADHPQVTVVPAAGSGVAGCQDEPEGCYIPTEAAVDVGGTVIFSNTDTLAHTFTAGTAAGGTTGVFDSGLVIAGATYEYTPETVGEIPYFCIVHPWMEGVIVAQAVDEMKDTHDDKDTHGDRMMKEATATGMMSDGTMVKIYTSEPTEGEMLDVTIKFKDSDGMMKEHVNYDIMVMQNGETVLGDEGAHQHEGKGKHMTQSLSSSDPVDITVTFQGYGIDDPKEGPVGEEVTFTNIVPEFGTITMMILAVAIIGIIAVTAKSRVIPRL